MAIKDMIYGLRPVYEALAAGKEMEKVIIQKGLKGKMYSEVWQLIRDGDIPFQFVPLEKMNALTRGNHQGIVGFLSQIEYQDITALLPMLFESGKMPFLLVLDRISDVRNFGALARTASCAGVDAILIPVKGGARISADAVKTSAGALHQIAVCRTPNLAQSVRFLKESGLHLIAATEKAGKYYDEGSYQDPLAIIMGSEEDGVSPELLTLADEQLAIPLTGEIASLNVSVACGVLLFEAQRHRRKQLEA